jgi:hypothetical protein
MTMMLKKNPYQITTLANLPGETWRDLPIFDDFYQVSSHGRIKSLSRLIEIPHPRGKTTLSYWTKERIRKIKVHKRWNSIVEKEYYECTISLNLSNSKEKSCLVHRLVYQAFIKFIDFETDQVMVMHTDGNGLNNHFRNLQAGSRNDVLKNAYREKRHISPFALKTKVKLKKIRQKASASCSKKIIQYSMKGERIKVFNSIKEASKKCGIADSNLSSVLKGKTLTAGNFLWRYFPHRKKISTKYIAKRKISRMLNSRVVVSQFSLAGQLIRSFPSISEAAEKMEISPSGISSCLAGRLKKSGGYIWKAK